MKKQSFPVHVSMLLVVIGIFSCRQREVTVSPFEETTFPIYGSFRLFKLPVEKGANILNPILIATAPDGKLWAANETGEVYHLVDTDGDTYQDSAALFCHVGDDGLHSPGSIAFRQDTVYLGTREEIRIYMDRDGNGQADTSWTFFDAIPESQHPYEWTSGICFGPDGWLYAALTTDSWNPGASPDPEGYRGAIIRISREGKAERMASGLRSAYGMAFHTSGQLFFADNAGGGNPKEELNLLVPGAFYGHNKKKYGDSLAITGPAHEFTSEIAPGGMEFNNTVTDFGNTTSHLFVAFYGPGERWNRGAVTHVAMDENSGAFTFKETVLADIPKLSDLSFGSDGALYLAHHGRSDYWYKPVESRSGGFYKLVYDPEVKGKDVSERNKFASDATPTALEHGKFLFAERACLSCHAIDGDIELLGPSLKNIRAKLSREEILEEIQNPSKIITPSMTALKITKTDGQILLGRPVNITTDTISVMLVGNVVMQVPRSDILKTETEMKSLMYDGMLYDLTDEDIGHLLDYILSL